MPSTSNRASYSVDPARADSVKLLRCSRSIEPSDLSSAARWWNVSSRSAGPPVRRPYSSAAAMSMPADETRATSSPVTASNAGRPSPAGATHAPPT
jgi:hypothetical protein